MMKPAAKIRIMTDRDELEQALIRHRRREDGRARAITAFRRSLLLLAFLVLCSILWK